MLVDGMIHNSVYIQCIIELNNRFGTVCVPFLVVTMDDAFDSQENCWLLTSDEGFAWQLPSMHCAEIVVPCLVSGLHTIIFVRDYIQPKPRHTSIL